MKMRIARVLRELAVPPQIMGYDYLKTAIELCINDSSLKHKMTTELYPLIAELHNTTAMKVERAIRHAIAVSIYNAPLDAVDQYVYLPANMAHGGVVTTPKNGEYIASIVEALIMQEV